MSQVIGPIRGIVHEFDTRSFGEDSNSYQLTANITDPQAIKAINEALREECKGKGVTYTAVNNPPLVAATDSHLDSALGAEGVMVTCRYRIDATHLTPFTENGIDYIDETRNGDFMRKMGIGRKIQFAIRFNALTPSAEAVTINGKVVRRARPNGAVYCDLIAILILKGVQPLGNALAALNFKLEDGEEAEEVEASTIVPNDQGATQTFEDRDDPSANWYPEKDIGEMTDAELASNLG